MENDLFPLGDGMSLCLLLNRATLVPCGPHLPCVVFHVPTLSSPLQTKQEKPRPPPVPRAVAAPRLRPPCQGYTPPLPTPRPMAGSRDQRRQTRPMAGCRCDHSLPPRHRKPRPMASRRASISAVKRVVMGSVATGGGRRCCKSLPPLCCCKVSRAIEGRCGSCKW
jgi:hypothetical protein